MKAVVQRVSRARVGIGGQEKSEIGRGLLVLLGVARGDESRDMEALMDKIAGLRIFADEQGKMNRSLTDVGGQVMIVSQFTLLGNCKKGRRPSFIGAAEPALGKELYQKAIDYCKAVHRLPVQSGEFGADMQVELVNDGPVTILLDSRELLS